MAYCDACNDLKDYAPGFMLNGVTEATCNSLIANTGLNPSLSVTHKNCEDLKDMADCLLGALVEKLPAYDECTLKDFIAQLAPNTYNAVYAIVCSQCGLWQRLEDLEELVDNLVKQTYVDLVNGRDYNVTFFNGWKSLNNSIDVSVQESRDLLSFRFSTSVSDSTVLYHDTQMKGVVLMRHANSVIAVPESAIFAINFIGNYAKYNNTSTYGWSNTNGQSNGIWNIRPTTDRAAWQSRLGLNRNLEFNGTTYNMFVSWLSYADGYNTQLSIYPSATLTIPSDAGANMEVTGTFYLR